MTKNIRKYVFPNIPYLAALWFCMKLGTAYRLSAGANAGMKLIGTMQTLGPVLQEISPGLNAFDWLVGIAGAALLRLIIFQKVKKAKNFGRMWSTVLPVGAIKMI